jgi:hypothetical protein
MKQLTVYSVWVMAEFCGGEWELWQQKLNAHAALNAATVDNIVQFWIK